MGDPKPQLHDDYRRRIRLQAWAAVVGVPAGFLVVASTEFGQEPLPLSAIATVAALGQMAIVFNLVLAVNGAQAHGPDKCPPRNANMSLGYVLGVVQSAGFCFILTCEVGFFYYLMRGDLWLWLVWVLGLLFFVAYELTQVFFAVWGSPWVERLLSSIRAIVVLVATVIALLCVRLSPAVKEGAKCLEKTFAKKNGTAKERSEDNDSNHAIEVGVPRLTQR